MISATWLQNIALRVWHLQTGNGRFMSLPNCTSFWTSTIPSFSAIFRNRNNPILKLPGVPCKGSVLPCHHVQTRMNLKKLKQQNLPSGTSSFHQQTALLSCLCAVSQALMEASVFSSRCSHIFKDLRCFRLRTTRRLPCIAQELES